MEEEDEEISEREELPGHFDYSGEKEPLITGTPPDWFTKADGHILFVLASGLTLTPSVIAENTDVSRVTVSRRLDTLRAAEYVEKVDRGKYKITKDGLFVITGDPEIYEDDSESDEDN